MNFIELAAYRSSIRNFSTQPVGKGMLLQILEAARMAPSAANFQPWQFIVISEPVLLQLIKEIYPREWFMTAPVVIAALGDHNMGWHRGKDNKDFTEVDVAIAIDHLTLAAADFGLGTCWVCNFDAGKFRELFNLPDNMEPIALIPIGYPATKANPEKQRKPIEKIVHWNQFKF